MKRSRGNASAQQRYQRLVAQLARLELIAQGTITERVIVRPDPQTRSRKKEYGPYYQWTWKREGKTVTINLTAAQAKEFQKAIDQQRRLEKILQQMRKLSLDILVQSTVGVVRRLRKSHRGA
jgi:hypothetical protein